MLNKKLIPATGIAVLLLVSPCAMAQMGAISNVMTAVVGNISDKVFGPKAEDFKNTTDDEIDSAVERHCGDMSLEQKVQCRKAFESMRAANDRLQQKNREMAQARQDKPILDAKELVGSAIQGEVGVRGAILQGQAAVVANKAGVSNRTLSTMLQGSDVNVVNVPASALPVAAPVQQTAAMPAGEVPFTNLFGADFKRASRSQVQEILAKNGVTLAADAKELVIENPKVLSSPNRAKIAFSADAQKITSLVYEYDSLSMRQVRQIIGTINAAKYKMLSNGSEDGMTFGTWKTPDGETLTVRMSKERGVVSYNRE